MTCLEGITIYTLERSLVDLKQNIQLISYLVLYSCLWQQDLWGTKVCQHIGSLIFPYNWTAFLIKFFKVKHTHIHTGLPPARLCVLCWVSQLLSVEFFYFMSRYAAWLPEKMLAVYIYRNQANVAFQHFPAVLWLWQYWKLNVITDVLGVSERLGDSNKPGLSPRRLVFMSCMKPKVDVMNCYSNSICVVFINACFMMLFHCLCM